MSRSLTLQDRHALIDAKGELRLVLTLHERKLLDYLGAAERHRVAHLVAQLAAIIDDEPLPEKTPCPS